MCYLCDSIGDKCPDLSYESFEAYAAGWPTKLRDDLLFDIRAKWINLEHQPCNQCQVPEAPESPTTPPPERPQRLVIVHTGENPASPLRMPVGRVLPFTDSICASAISCSQGATSSRRSALGLPLCPGTTATRAMQMTPRYSTWPSMSCASSGRESKLVYDF